jgi:hypothetical protein
MNFTKCNSLKKAMKQTAGKRKQLKKEATNLAKWARLATTTFGRCSLCLILCEPEEAEEPKRR